MYLLGYDIGSSSIKAALIECSSGAPISSAFFPKDEMRMIIKKPGWAEQWPQMWWKNLIRATKELKEKSKIDLNKIQAIGITYQMHGLVIVDKNHNVLRPSIIWCDSRAVKTGDKIAKKIGNEKCLDHLLNLPGNFTASKLRWVKENEPKIYSKIHKAMLPGDYIAMMMSGRITTTVSGLSEGILWDYKKNKLSEIMLDACSFSESLIPEITPCFCIHGELSKKAAHELGLRSGIKISYRAGDQPNNAFSLNVLEPGELAATAGTSGVVYGIAEMAKYDKESRVNTFVHVNHKEEKPRYGLLMCLNGTGILYSWLKHNIGNNFSYNEMNVLSEKVQPGSEGLFILPYGNGAERTLCNRLIDASVHNFNFNIHKKTHFLRAAQEGIVFALNYGIEIMKKMGIKVKKVKAGSSNMFLSPVFREAFANTTETVIELYESDGAQGAARGAGIGAGIYKNTKHAFVGLKKTATIEPSKKLSKTYQKSYLRWRNILQEKLRISKI